MTKPIPISSSDNEDLSIMNDQQLNDYVNKVLSYKIQSSDSDLDNVSNSSESTGIDFYSPKKDDRDSKWIFDQLHQGLKDNEKYDENFKSKSDAILSCPSCFTIVCIDCQQHQFYENQYRAMFVLECEVVPTEIYKYEEKKEYKPDLQNKIQFKPSLTNLIPTNTFTQSDYYAVRCNHCNQLVGVFDNEEVYHFFNVIASQS